jgi:hypothetical protein
LTRTLKRVQEGETVHDGGHHPHAVSATPIHPARRALHTAKEIASTYHDSNLNSLARGATERLND